MAIVPRYHRPAPDEDGNIPPDPDADIELQDDGSGWPEFVRVDADGHPVQTPPPE